MFRLDGKIALITGSGGGLGVGIARSLARQGAHILVNDIDVDRAEATAKVLLSEGHRGIAVPFDVTSHSAVVEAVSKVEAEIGPVDILVNNAGNSGAHAFQQKPFADLLPTQWQPFIDVNLLGVMNCTHAVLGAMGRRGWGRVITISSTAGRVGAAINVSIYGAAKAGAAHFMRHLSQEVARQGITANVIALGFMTTSNAEFNRKMADQVPAGRIGTGEDAGAATVYLASEEASWVTGATLVVDGGSTPF